MVIPDGEDAKADLPPAIPMVIAGVSRLKFSKIAGGFSEAAASIG